MKDKIYFAKMKSNAIIPSKKEEDAGYDFYACLEEDFFIINPGEVGIVPTGIAWAASKEYYLQIEERSSTGKAGIKKNGGVFDSGYRGEILIEIYNSRKETLILSPFSEEKVMKAYPKLKTNPYFFYSTKKAIAQGIVHKLPVLEAEELSYEDLLSISSERGSKRFGSSNKA